MSEVGARLRSEREARGWSKPQMARELLRAIGAQPERRRVASLVRQILDWERGQHFPRDWAAAYATAFGATEKDLFGHLQIPGGSVDEVKRRELLQTLALGAAVGPLASLEELRLGLGRALGPPDLADWERTAWEYGHRYWTGVTGQLAPELAVELAELRGLLEGDLPEPLRRGLHRVAAQLSALLAEDLCDLGEYGVAWRWWRTGRQAADASGDRDLAVWMRAREGMRSLLGGRAEHVTADLTQEALALAGGRPSIGLARALTNRAHMAAGHEDGPGVLVALHAVEKVAESLPDAATRDQVPAWSWPESTLWAIQASTLARVGDTARADAAIDRALALYPAELVHARAQTSLYRSMSLIQAREVGEGLNHALDTLAPALESGQRTTLIEHQVQRIVQVLPAQARALPAARELRALVG
ncbi:transcriptional regulator [Actinomadura hibisca]|uniref:transcriptional regulator n=1 Tax=Actinomadura hibisca TaxID=68565 RepID=UPI00082A45EB|nr:transcriptional regulator [Actinomadura hibisca]